MKKRSVFAGILCLSLISIQGALADHDWYKKYDRDRDGHWNYNEFARAQREWQIAHHEHVMSERELRDFYEQQHRDKDGFLGREEAARLHSW